MFRLQGPRDEGRTRRIPFSLATSIISGFISILTLIVFLGITGILNQSEITILGVTIGCILVTAVSYLIISVKLLRNDVSNVMLKVVRNVVIAAAAAFLFTIATSWDYSSQLNFFGNMWSYYSLFLMTHIFPFWIFAVFVVVSPLSFDYSWRKSGSQPPIVASHKDIRAGSQKRRGLDGTYF
jgi:hypothetical protein